MTKIVQDISILRQKSERVESVEEAKDLISKLEVVLAKTENGIGLAAIQLGYPKRVGVIKHKGSYIHLINPELVEGIDEFIFMHEGCLSFPEVYRDTKRCKQVIVKHQRIRDDKFEEETFSAYYASDSDEPGNDGLTAIAIQHELDHFEGKLLIDSNIKSEPIKREEKKVGRNEPCPCGSGKKYKKCCGNKI